MEESEDKRQKKTDGSGDTTEQIIEQTGNMTQIPDCRQPSARGESGDVSFLVEIGTTSMTLLRKCTYEHGETQQATCPCFKPAPTFAAHLN